MANEYSYERYNPERKKKSQYEAGWGTVTGALPALFGPLGLLAAAFTLPEGIKKDTKIFDDPEQALQIERENRRRAMLSGLPSRKPEQTSEMRDRISAWQAESKAPTDLSYFDKQIHEGPLATDWRFQRDQALAAKGAVSQASNIQNIQKAQGLSGGFENVGSIADVYDRLGAELAGLGQQQQALNQNIRQQRFAFSEQEKLRKQALADRAAQAQQDFVNSQISFENAVRQARAAIEADDVETAMRLINQANEVREQQKRANEQWWGNMFGGLATAGGAVAGGAMGGPQGAMLGGLMGYNLSGAFSGNREKQNWSMPMSEAEKKEFEDWKKARRGSVR